MEKILFIATIENHILNIHMPFINYFQERGYEVHVATKLGDRRVELEQYGVICHHINFSRSPYSLSTIIALEQLLKIMRAENFALVHVHTPVGAFLGRLAARLTKTSPVLYTAHGFHFYQGAHFINWLIYYSMERLVARWTDGIVTMNEEDFQLAKNFSLRRVNSVYYAHGVGLPIDEYRISDNGNMRKRLREQMGYKDEDTLILTIAELNKNKNQIQLIKALHEILKHKNNVYLLLVGTGKLESKLKNLVDKFQISKNVVFLGYRKDIPELLYISDVFALTSLREGLPRSIMEAMAVGKPVIATSIRGNKDLVRDNVNGYLVPINDVSETSSAILRLVNHRELAFEMGKKGREMIAPYAIENVLKEMASIYNKISPFNENANNF
jgi:glycosyltransferase involved in cell wall biosynthesis